MATLKILHTSDWHIGHQLYGNRRDDEFGAFLAWLNDILAKEHIDILIVAGDIFDTAMPSSTAQALYYDFLSRASAAGVGHVVIIAGNHDSPSFLTAPAHLLRGMHIHVIGAVVGNPEDEILELANRDGIPVAIICAVPFLRERDMRSAEAGESIEDKERKLAEGVRRHYQDIAALAAQRRAALGLDVPIIATGHIHASGAIAGSGVRPLYIGGLGAIATDIFPPDFDYVALGHFHKPQKVGGMHTRRYCGSPLPMGFDEINDNKQILIVSFNNNIPEISAITVPSFRKMRSIRGDADSILASLARIVEEATANDAGIWVEVKHTGDEPGGDLREAIDKLTHDSQVRVLIVKREISNTVPGVSAEGKDLRQMEPLDVFSRLLELKNLDGTSKNEMMSAFQELLLDWQSCENN